MAKPFHLSRRRFLGTAVLPAVAPVIRMGPLSDKVRVAQVGVGGRGAGNLAGILGEQVVALCDVDTGNLNGALATLEARGTDPTGVKTYSDWRKLLDAGGIDALLVSTPDHTHAHPSLRALREGLAVYTEKPLAHTVEEAALLRRVAAEAGRPTQMGTQIHAGENYRRVVELVRAGVIGDIKEVHVLMGKAWADGRYGPEKQPPASLDWQAWLGPNPDRPYCDGLHPAGWRRFWAFGTGTLGDMGCHHLDLVHWALDLDLPEAVSCEGPEVHPDGAPAWCHATWEHRARGGRAAVKVHWWDGGRKPELKDSEGQPIAWNNGCVFFGERGVLCADYGRYQLLPAKRFEGFEPPARTIAPSIGHHAEWLEAVRSGGPTTCDFSYSGPLSEVVILGTVAFRAGKRLTGCSDGTLVEKHPEVAPLLTKEYRKGWEL